MNRKVLEKGLSSRKRSLLGPLFKISSVDGKSVEDSNNFPDAAEVIAPIKRKFGLLDQRCVPRIKNGPVGHSRFKEIATLLCRVDPGTSPSLVI